MHIVKEFKFQKKKQLTKITIICMKKILTQKYASIKANRKS